MELKQKLTLKFFPFVQKPLRYLGNEFNSLPPGADESRSDIVLCYPDGYEAGIRQVTFELLFHLLNSRKEIRAERCYLPATDAEHLLCENQLPLFSLESHRAIGMFDIIAFQLDDPLYALNLAAMLSLGDVPLFSGDRPEEAPLVIAYSDTLLNPEPVAAFCDVIVPGFSLQLIPDMISVLQQAAKAGLSRRDRLATLAGRGYYIPSFYRDSYSGFGEFQALSTQHPQAPSHLKIPDVSLVETPVSFKPLVSLGELAETRAAFSTPVVPARVAVEYRNRYIPPVNSGLSGRLAASAYRQIDRLGFEGLMPLLQEDAVIAQLLWSSLKEASLLEDFPLTLSMPALELRTMGLELSDLRQQLLRHPFPVAVYSAAPRLRQMLNINIRDHELTKLVHYLAEQGWKEIQLQFLIGLPGETDADIEALVALLREGRKILQPFPEVVLSTRISVFTPLPHTSLQWEQVEGYGTLSSRVEQLRQTLPKELTATLPDLAEALMRAVLLRGDRRLATVVSTAAAAGARFSTCEHTAYADTWEQAISAAGLKQADFRRARSIMDPLPWDHIVAPATRQGLRDEKLLVATNQLQSTNRDRVSLGETLTRERFQKLLSEQYRLSLEDAAPPPLQAPESKPAISYGRRDKKRQQPQAPIKKRLRARYTKSAAARYLSHKEIIRAIEMAARSAKIPLVYSQGQRPAPKIAYGSPLSAGIASTAEYLDMELIIGREADLRNHLNNYLPGGLEILQFQGIFAKVPALAAVINRSTYEILIGETDIPAEWLEKWLAREDIPVQRPAKDGIREVNIRPHVTRLEKENDRIHITIDGHAGQTAKVTELLESLLKPENIDHRQFFVQRTGQFIVKENSVYTPLEILS